MPGKAGTCTGVCSHLPKRRTSSDGVVLFSLVDQPKRAPVFSGAFISASSCTLTAKRPFQSFFHRTPRKCLCLQDSGKSMSKNSCEVCLPYECRGKSAPAYGGVSAAFPEQRLRVCSPRDGARTPQSLHHFEVSPGKPRPLESLLDYPLPG